MSYDAVGCTLLIAWNSELIPRNWSTGQLGALMPALAPQNKLSLELGLCSFCFSGQNTVSILFETKFHF